MIVVHALLLYFLLTLPPSPYELARSGQIENVVEILETLRGTENVDNEARYIIKAVEDEKLKSRRSMSGAFLLMDMKMIKKTLIIMTVFSFSHISGVYFIGTFVVDIFKPHPISNHILVVVTGSSEFICSFFQTVIADKLGR